MAELSKFMLTDIPPDLWQKFKMLCVMEKLSMRKKLREMIQNEVEKATKRYMK